jgi:glycosyltransferase involved in cell wall biosynthesis
MRIICTVNCKWWNGTAQGAVTTARALLLAGHDVLVQTGGSDEVKKHLAEFAVPFLEPIGLYPGLVTMALKFRPDAVIAFESAGQAAAAITLPGIPLVRYRSDQRKARGGRFWSIIDSRTDLVVFPGNSMIEKGFQGPRTGKTAVIPHPVDTEYFHCSEHEAEPIILSIGRLSPVKGHKTLIKAMTVVRTDHKAVIAGGDAQYSAEQLMGFARDHGVGDRIEFVGRVDDVRPLLKKSRVGVVTSLGSEAVSRAGMEIMACGVPLLAASTNGLLDLVKDGVTGLLHSPGNHLQLAAQINHLVENTGLSDYLSDNARVYCETCLSLDNAGRLWTREMEQVCFG